MFFQLLWHDNRQSLRKINAVLGHLACSTDSTKYVDLRRLHRMEKMLKRLGLIPRLHDTTGMWAVGQPRLNNRLHRGGQTFNRFSKRLNWTTGWMLVQSQIPLR